jgi:hypothetical protein
MTEKMLMPSFVTPASADDDSSVSNGLTEYVSIGSTVFFDAFLIILAAILSSAEYDTSLVIGLSAHSLSLDFFGFVRRIANDCGKGKAPNNDKVGRAPRWTVQISAGEKLRVSAS